MCSYSTFSKVTLPHYCRASNFSVTLLLVSRDRGEKIAMAPEVSGCLPQLHLPPGSKSDQTNPQPDFGCDGCGVIRANQEFANQTSFF